MGNIKSCYSDCKKENHYIIDAKDIFNYNENIELEESFIKPNNKCPTNSLTSKPTNMNSLASREYGIKTTNSLSKNSNTNVNDDKDTIDKQLPILYQTKEESIIDFTKLTRITITNMHKIFLTKCLLKKEINFLNYNESLYKQFILITIPNRRSIYRIRDPANGFYLVYKGRFESFKDFEETNLSKNVLGSEDFFGDESLVELSLRNSNVYALQDSVIFCLDVQKYRDYISNRDNSIVESFIKLFKSLPYFSELDPLKINELANSISITKFTKDVEIFQENSKAKEMYILIDGKVSLSTNRHKHETELGSNILFGHIGLLYAGKYMYTAKTKSNVRLIKLTQTHLINVLGNDYLKHINNSMIKMGLRKNLLPEEILFTKLDEMSNEFEFKYLDPNQELDDENIYIFLSGGIMLMERKIETHLGYLLLQKNCFNKNKKKLNLLNKLKSLKYYKSSPELICLIARSNMIIKRIRENQQLNLIDKISNLKIVDPVNKDNLSKICNRIDLHIYEPDSKIIKQGNDAMNLYIIIKGTVALYRDNVFYHELEQGCHFGLLSAETKMYKYTAFAISAVEVGVIFREDLHLFDKLLIWKNTSIDCEPDINNFMFKKNLGNGKFGHVTLVKNIIDENFYSIKAMPKIFAIENQKLASFIINERNILQLLNHQFILNLINFMNDKNFVYILTDFIDGCTLREYLKNRDEECTYTMFQFYAAGLFTILEYNFSKFIVHRDIKPDNLMIDTNGYMKMIDFGTAKIIKNYTKTVIGTPLYLAPEVVKGQNYSLSVDIWSAGVTLYELLYNRVPFGNNCKQIMEIYNEILNKDINLILNDSDADELIGNMLVKNPNNRIIDISYYKNSQLFNDFKWNDFEFQKLKSPYFPQSKATELSDEKITFKEYSHTLEKQISNKINKDINISNHNKIEDFNNKWCSLFYYPNMKNQ